MADKDRGVAHWDPFADLGFSDWGFDLPHVGRLRRLLGEGEVARRIGVIAPAVDITESDDRYLIKAEIPGVKKGDLTLEVREGVLTLRGEKKEEREEGKDRGRHLERVFGAFSRSFSLPGDANAERIDATFSDGVLAISIPKRPETKAAQVSIKG